MGRETVRRAWCGGARVIVGAVIAIMAAAAVPSAAQSQQAQPPGARIGLLAGVTGPIATVVGPIRRAADLAVSQVNEQGGILGGKLSLATGDSRCDPAAAEEAARRLVEDEKVAGIVGAICSAATVAAAENVTVGAGVVLISPGSDEPALTSLKDKDFVFRVIGNYTRAARVLARGLAVRGIRKVALIHAETESERKLAETFRAAFKRRGGAITAEAKVAGTRKTYEKDIAALLKDGARHLVVFVPPKNGGTQIVAEAVKEGRFARIAGAENLYDRSLWQRVGLENLEGMIFARRSLPGTHGYGLYAAAMKRIDADSVDRLFTAQTYDATFLLALAIQAAGSTDRAKVRDALRRVTDGRGATVYPGQWSRALRLIKARTAIDYIGATGRLDFDKAGDPKEQPYALWQIQNGTPKILAIYK